MSLITRSSAITKARAANVAALGRRAGQSEQARRVAAQAAPFARSAQMTAQRGVYSARVWTAPRLELTGRFITERAAPRLSAMMSAAARRVEPSRPRRRRWPVLVIGLATVAGGGAAAGLALSRRGRGSATESSTPGETTASPAGRETTGADTTSDIDQHAHTP